MAAYIVSSSLCFVSERGSCSCRSRAHYKAQVGLEPVTLCPSLAILGLAGVHCHVVFMPGWLEASRLYHKIRLNHIYRHYMS